MTTSEWALLKTTILVCAADALSAFHGPAKQLRDQGIPGDIAVAVRPQILCEFFAVVTHPRRVTQPRAPQEARAEMAKYLHAPAMYTL
jgi:hypothetical protein